jgi:hypothetical protein
VDTEISANAWTPTLQLHVSGVVATRLQDFTPETPETPETPCIGGVRVRVELRNYVNYQQMKRIKYEVC